MTNITEEELTLLRNCNNSKDWQAACNKIKKAHEPYYPDDWWKKVLQSGLATQLALKWGNPAAFDLNIAVPKPDGSLQVIATLKLEDRYEPEPESN